jgi:hypothetical protein
MRFRFLTIAIGAVLSAGLLAGLGLAAPSRLLLAQSSAVPVDTELVLAVDVSYSMDPDEQQIQREGYIDAITSREFMTAIRAGSHGKVALTYFEWAGPDDQKIIVPWRVIEGPETADAFAGEIARAPYRRASRTSIGGALMFAKPLFAASGFRGLRRVIDVSGDGPNNSGPLVVPQRDDIVASGITINGLPLMLNRPNSFSMDIADLDIYFEDCVIGGPGAFVIPVRDRAQFKEAIRTKLIMEVAELKGARVQPVQARSPRVSCTVGEQMWRDRWGN